MKLLFKQDIRKATNLSKPQSIIAYFNGYRDGKQTKIQSSTGHAVLPKHFSNRRVVNTYEKHDINASLKKMEAIFHEEVEEVTQKGLDPDKALLIRTIRKAQGLDPEIPKNLHLLDYIDTFLSKMDTIINSKGELGLSKNTQKNYRHLKVIYNEYSIKRTKEGKSKITLQHATNRDLEHFREYLHKQKYSNNTITKRIKEIKSITNHAKRNVIKVSSVFTEFRNAQGKSKSKEEIIYLTEEEISQITNPDLDLPPYLENAQRIVIIHLATGQRVSDIMKLNEGSFRAEKDGTFTAVIRQQKTGKEVSIPIIGEQALEVVRTGLFRAISDQKYNIYIKELGKRAEIDTIIKAKERKKVKNGFRNVETEGEKYRFISSHTFRRTALTRLYQTGIPEYHILQISGHSKSETLHAYLGIDPNKEAQTLELKRMLQEKTQKNTIITKSGKWKIKSNI